MKSNFTNLVWAVLILTLSIIIVSCAKEGTIITEDPKPIEFPVSGEIIETSFYGRVVDKEDNPIKGALVICKSCFTEEIVESDETGNFLFSDIENLGNTAFIAIEHSGMFKAFRRLSVFSGQTAYTEIELREKKQIGSFKSTAGETLSTADGSAVTLPANGIADSNGQPYQGTVNVYMTWIDPSSEDLAQDMIGDLSGIDNESAIVSLITFGMVMVELTDPNGNELNLLDGFEAELRFPVPEDKIAIAPQSIPLWYYDENNGYWVEESVAHLEGNFYVGTVEHFSSWNVDIKGESIDISGNIYLERSQQNFPASYYEVYVCSPSFGTIGGWLCNDGSFLFYNFPIDEEFDLKIKDYCGHIIHEGTYGPYSSDTVLDPIEVSSSNGSKEIVISGNALDCSLNSFANGQVVLDFGSKSYVHDLDLDGSFEFLAVVCEDFNAEVYVIDLDNLNQSEKINLTNLDSSYEYKDVIVCTELEEYFYLNIEGYHEELKLRDSETAFGVSDQDANSNLFLFCKSDFFTFYFNAFDFDPNVSLNTILYGDSSHSAGVAYLNSDGIAGEYYGTMENMELLFTEFEYDYDNWQGSTAKGHLSGFVTDVDGVRYDINGSFSILPQ